MERLRLLESVVGHAKDAVVVTEFDDSGEPCIVFVNPAFTEQTGYAPQEVIGQHPRLLVRPDGDLEPQLRIRNAVEERRPVTVELLHYRKDGSSFWVENNINPVTDATGRCTHLVSLQRDVTERKKVEQELAYQALHDALTGLPNRTLLADRLQQALVSGHRRGNAVGLLLMDLDRFKAINDTLGHKAGDQVLQQVAVRLATALRASDTVARLGGDEFAVVLPDIGGLDEARRVATKLLTAFDAPFDIDGLTIRMDASVGITVAPLHGDDSTTLLQRADVAMYRAKATATSTAVFEEHPDNDQRERLGLLVDLRDAIESCQLRLHYQPILDLRTDAISAVEALVRWQHPALGLLNPADFIPLAEETGLVRSLTEWVLGAALRQARAWMRDDGSGMRVAVNLSARLLQDAGIVETVIDALRHEGVPAELLELEITESACMSKPDTSLEVIAELAAAGVRFTIDDFGTGYSSLAYLKRLPVHQIKIDKSFVVDMADDLNDASIVRSVIDLGHNLGLEVVAEGVEDALTLHLLRGAGCDYAQGFHVGRPAEALRLVRPSGGRSFL
jgi:diguanylate cyclase (GGDEF)-like protein/PAS domain S-box-containing protein